MFAKVFAQIFDSSIAEDYNCRRMFMDLLVLADPTGAVDMTHEAISRRTNVPLTEVVKYIQELCQPDLKSRSAMEEGKRLIPLDPSRDWGWRIVNYAYYRKIKNQEALREYFREKQREHRAKKRAVKDNVLTSVDEVGQSLTSLHIPSSSTSRGKRVQRERGYEVPAALENLPSFAEEWEAFIEMRKTKRAKLTDRAAQIILNRLAEKPDKAMVALSRCIEKNWTSFEWDWINQTNGVNGRVERSMSAFEIEKRVATISQEINLTFKKNGGRVAGDGIDELKQRRDALRKQLLA